VPIRVIDVSAVNTGGGSGQGGSRATVQFEQTGINLRVTPHVTGNRQILMEVHAERSNVRPASVDIGFTFQTQQADNQILVSDGETAVIGGLTVTEVTVTKSGIPFLVESADSRQAVRVLRTKQRIGVISLILITPTSSTIWSRPAGNKPVGR